MSSSKGYESRAVQTTFSPPPSPCSVVSPQPLPVDGGLQSEMSTSAVGSLFGTPDNPSQSPGGSLVSYLSTPDRSITTSRRVFKARLAPNFPSRVTNITNQRIASEPGTVPLFSVKSQIAAQERVVSMPEDLRSKRLGKAFVLYPPEFEDSPLGTSTSLSISDGNDSFGRADAIGTDISYQSSSPSSPDSLVIIQHKYHISQAFLRQTRVQTKAKTDEDWMTWASSPPRPIPALHGPSSLPYARCPSGAEGTIIEEQDNLSRMIWGLDQDTAKPETTPSESSNHTSETVAVLGVTGGASDVVTPQNPSLIINIENATPVGGQNTHLPNFIEPIDLGPMLAPRIQERACQYQPPQIDVVHMAPVGVADPPLQQKVHHERRSGRGQEVGVGLKPLPRRHETYNTTPLVTTQPVVGSSLPIIILESQPHSMSVPTKRRQSAMEIAQQYRKNQALFQPVAQSRRSSNPYSPPVQAIHLPTLSAEVSEPSLSNQTRAYNNSGNDVYLDSHQNSAYGLHHAASLSRAQNVFVSPGSDLGSYPRPPPNTPMNALAKSRAANVTLRVNHLPASPDSPSTGIRSLQYTKATPISRLSNRRLSAVFEAFEDQNASVGMRPLSPPPFQQNFHLSRPLIPDGTVHPSCYRNLAKDRQSNYYQLENTSKVNATLVSEEFAKLTLESSTPGWIQSQANPHVPVVKVDSQQVRRDRKTGKPGLSGKIRVQGQKNQPQGQASGRRNRSKKKVADGMVVITG